MKYLLAFALLLSGCSHSQKVAVTKTVEYPGATVTSVETAEAPRPLTDNEKIGLLRHEAHKLHLRWKVYCVDNQAWNFQADAEPKSQPVGAIYIEDGAKDFWIETGMTQAEAAYALYISIQQPANGHPEHNPLMRHRKLCPPELRGD